MTKAATVTIRAYGSFTHGIKKGHVNPKSYVDMTLNVNHHYENPVKDTIKEATKDFDGLWTIQKVAA